MVHKKYLIVKSKRYGPYYYESYRKDGKVMKRYIKNPILHASKPFPLLLVGLITILFILPQYPIVLLWG